MQLEEYFRRQKYPEEYPSSSTPSPDGEQDETLSDNPLDRTFKSSITTDDTSDEDFDAGRYSTPQGKKVRVYLFSFIVVEIYEHIPYF